MDSKLCKIGFLEAHPTMEEELIINHTIRKYTILLSVKKTSIFAKVRVSNLLKLPQANLIKLKEVNL